MTGSLNCARTDLHKLFVGRCSSKGTSAQQQQPDRPGHGMAVSVESCFLIYEPKFNFFQDKNWFPGAVIPYPARRSPVRNRFNFIRLIALLQSGQRSDSGMDPPRVGTSEPTTKGKIVLHESYEFMRQFSGWS